MEFDLIDRIRDHTQQREGMRLGNGEKAGYRDQHTLLFTR